MLREEGESELQDRHETGVVKCKACQSAYNDDGDVYANSITLLAFLIVTSFLQPYSIIVHVQPYSIGGSHHFLNCILRRKFRYSFLFVLFCRLPFPLDIPFMRPHQFHSVTSIITNQVHQYQPLLLLKLLYFFYFVVQVQ